jgi:hypothetical protein
MQHRCCEKYKFTAGHRMATCWTVIAEREGKLGHKGNTDVVILRTTASPCSGEQNKKA